MDEQSQIFISDGAGEEGGWGGENDEKWNRVYLERWARSDGEAVGEGEIRIWGHHLFGSTSFSFNLKSGNQFKLWPDCRAALREQI